VEKVPHGCGAKSWHPALVNLYRRIALDSTAFYRDQPTTCRLSVQRALSTIMSDLSFYSGLDRRAALKSLPILMAHL
jgi:hypothetical protein